jgi:hypothetical protein
MSQQVVRSGLELQKDGTWRQPTTARKPSTRRAKAEPLHWPSRNHNVSLCGKPMPDYTDAEMAEVTRAWFTGRLGTHICKDCARRTA